MVDEVDPHDGAAHLLGHVRMMPRSLDPVALLISRHLLGRVEDAVEEDEGQESAQHAQRDLPPLALCQVDRDEPGDGCCYASEHEHWPVSARLGFQLGDAADLSFDVCEKALGRAAVRGQLVDELDVVCQPRAKSPWPAPEADQRHQGRGHCHENACDVLPFQAHRLHCSQRRGRGA